jgi:hypothetical protein
MMRITKSRPPEPALASLLVFLLGSLDEAFDRKSWHGPNLMRALRGVTAEQAAWRPQPGGHNIWELALHAAYWKYAVRRKLTGAKRGAFVLKGSNFFLRPEAGGFGESAWKADLAILRSEHQTLREVVANCRLPGDAANRERVLHLIRGIAAHDLYHAGQIRLLRKLVPRKLSSAG